MGWNNQVFSLVIITASGSFTGLFVYSPSPGAGNLVDSITAQSGTDPYGNAYVAGVTSYASAGTFFASMNAAGILFTVPNITAQGSILPSSGAVGSGVPALSIISPANISGANNSQALHILVGESSDTTVGPYHVLSSVQPGGGTIQTINVLVCGALFYTFSGVGGGSATAETWHTLPLTGTFAQNAGHTACQYRRLASPANCVQIKGDATVTSFSGNANITTALPAAYRPGVAQSSDFQVATSGQAPHYQLDTTGIFSIQQAGAGTTRVVFNEIFSLDS